MPTIRERNGSYQIEVFLGRDIYGKKIRESITYTPDPALTPKKKQKAVEDFAREFEAQLKRGITMDGRKITLKEFSDRWLEEYAAQKHSAIHQDCYDVAIIGCVLLPDVNIIPALNAIPCHAVAGGDINEVGAHFSRYGGHFILAHCAAPPHRSVLLWRAALQLPRAGTDPAQCGA